MPSVMPSQVVQTIDEQFTHAAQGREYQLQPQHSPQLIGILNLIKAIPPELLVLSPPVYADLVLATSTIEYHLNVWSRGTPGVLAKVKNMDVATLLRKILVQCPDEFPAPSTTDLQFIKDDELRDSLQRDVGAAIRALNNSEWKAATILAGATIEALLHWKLQEPPITIATRDAAVAALVAQKAMNSPPKGGFDHWYLHHFVEVATHLKVVRADTATEARLAQNFRNLIHPGKAARLKQTCDRGTAYTAIGALDHVIRDIA